MTQAVQSSTAKNNIPSQYAKLYYAKKNDDNTFDLDSIFEKTLPASKYLSELYTNEESEKFFADKKSFWKKLSAGGEAFIMSFVTSLGIIATTGNFIFNKLSERRYEKIIKPTGIGLYSISFLFAGLGYLTGCMYNKNLNEIDNLYHKAGKKERKKADKFIKEIYSYDKQTHSFEFIKNMEMNSKMKKLQKTLEDSLIDSYISG